MQSHATPDRALQDPRAVTKLAQILRGLISHQNSKLTMIGATSSPRSMLLVAIAAVAVLSGVILAEIKEECAMEIAVLENNTALQTEFAALLNELKVDTDQDGCNANSLTDYNCTLQFSGATSVFESLCANASGTIFQDTLSLDCSFLFDLTDVAIDINDIPFCVGSSCDLAALNATDLDGRISEFENTKDRLRTGGHCQVNSKAPNRVNGMAFGVLVTTVVALISFSF